MRETTVWLGGIQISRLTGITNDPNFTGWIFVITIFVFLSNYRIQQKLRHPARVLSLLLTLAAIVGVILTWSRGSLIALAISALVWVLTLMTSEQNRFGRVALITLSLSILAMLLFTPPLWNDGHEKQNPLFLTRLTERFNQDSLGSNARLQLWSNGLATFRDSLVWGSGYPVRVTLNDDPRPRFTHSTWIDILASGGVIGSTLFSGFLITALAKTFIIPRNRRELIYPVLVATLVSVTFLSSTTNSLFWLVLLFPYFGSHLPHAIYRTQEAPKKPLRQSHAPQVMR